MRPPVLPAPTWGEQAIAEHRRAADGITRVHVIEPPDLGPGIGGAPIRVRPTATEPCKGPLLSPAEQADPSFADALLVAQDRHREAAAVHPTTETDRQRATLHAGDPERPDPRVDYSDDVRPAVLGGECAECLHAPPLHERTCSKVRTLTPEIIAKLDAIPLHVIETHLAARRAKRPQ